MGPRGPDLGSQAAKPLAISGSTRSNRESVEIEVEAGGWGLSPRTGALVPMHAGAERTHRTRLGGRVGTHRGAEVGRGSGRASQRGGELGGSGGLSQPRGEARRGGEDRRGGDARRGEGAGRRGERGGAG